MGETWEFSLTEKLKLTNIYGIKAIQKGPLDKLTVTEQGFVYWWILDVEILIFLLRNKLGH